MHSDRETESPPLLFPCSGLLIPFFQWSLLFSLSSLPSPSQTEPPSSLSGPSPNKAGREASHSYAMLHAGAFWIWDPSLGAQIAWPASHCQARRPWGWATGMLSVPSWASFRLFSFMAQFYYIINTVSSSSSVQIMEVYERKFKAECSDTGAFLYRESCLFQHII